MSFTTLTFAVFLLIVFSVYWLLLAKRYKWQNLWLLIAGYIFYGWWDWRFLGLIFATTIVSWGCSLAQKKRKTMTAIAVIFNLLILCIFKYFNFFGDGLNKLFEVFGGELDWFTIDVLLPVGISFYTFQAISYSVDVYKRKIEPASNFITYSVYIAFFPQLVAGPIERAQQLLPQFERARRWNYASAVLGMRQILWGLFKKCAIADGVAFWVDNGFTTHINDGTLYGNFQCFLAVVGFALQIYGDFSGYSDIARGTARLFGINLMNNFLYPFFSRNAIELWHRWHRSLMQWFTEYVYIPLGGSQNGRKAVNVMIVFLLSGLWHGADITFLFWGLICGIWYLISMIIRVRKYRPGDGCDACLIDLPKITFTFVLFCLAFISFRAENIDDAFIMYRNTLFPGIPLFAIGILASWIIKILRVKFSVLIYSLCGFLVLGVSLYPVYTVKYVLGFSGFSFAAIMLAAEWKSKKLSFALENMPKKRWIRVTIYTLLYFVIYSSVLESNSNDFIYFQF